MGDADNTEGNGEELQKLITQLGRKVIDIQKDVNIPIEREGIATVVYARIFRNRKRNTVLASIEDTNEYKVLLDALDETSEIVGDRRRFADILNEFVFETIIEIPRGRSWDVNWVDQELSLMARAVLDGLSGTTTDTGIVIPLHSITMDESRIDLGEFGALRRATFDEKLDFAVRYPKDTQATRNYRFKYVLDMGQTDSIDLFPIPAKYSKTLRSVILALRLLHGGCVGLEYVHVWSQPYPDSDETVIFTYPISRYLRPRSDVTNVISGNADHLLKIIRSISELDESSFYGRSLRRYGAALYTLDYGFGDAIVDCVIGLECMFSSDKRKAIHRILEITRDKQSPFSRLLETQFPIEVHGIEFQTLLEKCWTARHKIVHGESSVVAENEVGMKLYYLSRIALMFLRYSLLSAAEFDFPNRKELLQKLDSYP